MKWRNVIRITQRSMINRAKIRFQLASREQSFLLRAGDPR